MVFDNGIYRKETPEEIEEFKRIENEQKIQALKNQIMTLKAQLAATDYQAIKHSEGWISEDEYTPIKAERQKIRDKINELESE